MKEDNNIKPLISAILNLSLKLSKCQNPKSAPKSVPKATRRKMKGGGSIEFFE